jgi:hypothetical protein
MKRLPLIFGVILILNWVCFSQVDYRIPGRIIVKFEHQIIGFPAMAKGKVSPADFAIHSQNVRNIVDEIGTTQFEKVFKDAQVGDTLVVNKRTEQLVKVKDLSQVYLIHFDETTDLDAVVNKFRKLPEVIYAHPDYMALECADPVNDDEYGNQWYLNDANHHDVNAPEAWEITQGDPNVIIALIEKGVEKFHIDLETKSYAGEYDSNNPNMSHGTRVAGVAAGHTNNNEGIASLAYNCRFMPRKSDGSLSQRSADIENSANEGADIINCSFTFIEPGGPWWQFPNWNALYDAIEHAFLSGSAIAAAMGNASTNGGVLPYQSLPAAMELGVISVGGTTQPDQWWTNNGNYGYYIDVSAPAVNIITTDNSPGNSYEYVNGTSFSAPLTSTLAGLLLSVNPGLTPDDIEQIIRLSANDVEESGIGWDEYTGTGRIDARAALDLLRAPYSLTHVAVTGGSKVKTEDNYWYSVYKHMFSGIATANYFGDQYKVTKTVTFPKQYINPPHVWVRIAGIDKNGWPDHDQYFSILGKPYVEVKNVTTTGCTFETYIYDLYDVVPQYLGYVPCEASEIKFDYTVLGIELVPPQITGFTQTPNPIVAGHTGNVYCNATGTSPLQYTWQILQNTAGATITFTGKRV